MAGEAKSRQLTCFAGKLVAKLGVNRRLLSATTLDLRPQHYNFDIFLKFVY